MKCKSFLTNFLKLFDLFSLNQFLRYNSDEDYKTASGGLISLFVITIFAAIFTGNALATFNKTDVKWSATKEIDFQPKPVNLSFEVGSKTMFAIGIIGMNLNNPYKRFFDVEMRKFQITNQSIATVNRVIL